VMAWILDEYSSRQGYSPAVVTGKPIALGGSLGREEATGRGVMYVMQEYARDFGIPIKGGRVVIQGFGNVGSHLARLLAADGAQVVAISDSRGGLYNPNGIDVQAALAHKRESGSLEGLKGAEEISNEELLLVDCDVLAPCALEQVLTEENADQVKAQIICEGANGPTTPPADDILESKGIMILPDVLPTPAA